MSDTVQSLMQGKSKEELEKQGKGWGAKIMKVVVPLVLLGLFGRYLYTQHKKK